MEHLIIRFKFGFKLAIHNIMYSNTDKISTAIAFINNAEDLYHIDRKLMDKYLELSRLFYITTINPLECPFKVDYEKHLQEILKEIMHQYKVYLLTLSI